jgi:tetratricopeptide (TPR) repeat protein
MSARKETKSELAAALKEAAKAPHKDEPWNHLEEVAAREQRPDEVADLYRKVVREADRPELLALVAPRAVRFHEEWYGVKADELAEILTRVIELDPNAEWALRRLSVFYTVKERWNDLLALYDRALAGVDDGSYRRELLTEAVRVAKDFIGDSDRTIVYLTELQRLSPGDAHLAGQLERLLERQGRWQALAALWQARLPALSPAEARGLRTRAATLRVDKLDDPAGALADLAPVLATGQGDEAARALADRILRAPAAPVAVRRQALQLLRTRYQDEPGPLVATLEAALAFTEPVEQAALHREMAERLAAAGDRRAAMDHLGTLLTLSPGDDQSVDRLRQLSEGEGDPRRYLRSLDAAAAAAGDGARRVELWMEAARIHDETLQDPQAAVAYYRLAFRERGGEPALRLEAARKLVARLGEVPDAAESPGERLAVLEALAAELESAQPRSPERRAALVEAARLAEERGDVERAAMAFGLLVDMDPADRAGLDGLVSLLERAQRWEPLAAALRRRVTAAASPADRRADLVRLAQLQAGPLGQAPAAVDTWLEVLRAFGEDGEVTEALTELYTTTGRWGELAELLSRAGEREGNKLCDLMCRLGDAYRERLGDPRKAMDCYARALQASPGHAGALAGVRALLDVPSCRTAAAEALARTYDASGDWMGLLDLLELRLGNAADDGARVRLLMEAAALAERKANDPSAALAFVARALPLAPDDAGPERELHHLSATTRNFRVVVEALRAAAGATRDPLRAARLRLAEGQLDEQELDDLTAALAAYRAAYERDPNRPEVREALVRAAARSGRWDLAAQATLAPGVPREALERTLLPLLENLCAEAGAYAPLAEAAATVLAASDRPVDPGLGRDLDVRLARWCELGGEATSPGAEVALQRAATQARLAREAGGGPAAGPDRLQASEPEILQRLAEAQRRKPGRALCETLLQLADLSPGDLDPLREAAAVALKTPAAEPLAGTLLGRLYDQATRLLRAGTPAAGRAAADEAAAWAVEQLVRTQLERADRSAWTRALDLLLDATRLPLPRETIRQLRWRATTLSVERLHDRRTAIAALRQMVEEQPDDQEALHRLAALYEEDKRLPELLALRQDELVRTQQVERRLALRLEMEKIAAALEERSGRLDMLRANLEEQPGHRPTIETLARALEAKGRHGELVDILTAQATRLEERGEGASAARMWDWIAQLLEAPIGDRDRAIRAYERVAELGPRPETFESLGRLVLGKGDALGAAAWLERWQEAAQGEVRTRAALELSGAYLAGDKRARAVACLERALAEDPKSNEVRGKLVELYRKGEAWEPLTRVLNDGTAYSTDKEAILANAREAADISQRYLGSPLAALGALERAVALHPQDASLRSLYAEALAAAGEQGRAREILEALIRESGRRRSRERAALHHRLARVARAENKTDEALAQLEQAADMDTENAAVLEALAELADGLGDHDRAERAYRALVLLVRRGGKGANLSTTETLLRLRRIALGRKQEDKAQDLLDSAIADAITSPEEARRLAAALRAEGARDVLRTVLDRRLAAASDPALEAQILAEQAELFEGEGNRAGALEALMSALAKAPEIAPIRQAARRAAREAAASVRLVDSLQALASERRRSEDAALHAALLAEAAEAALEDLGDEARATELWGQAAQAGVEGGLATIEAAYRLVRLGQARGGAAERSKAVKALGRFGKPGVAQPLRIEALFRLAEAQMGAEDSRDEGLAALASALELSGDVERAFALVRGANVPDSELPRVLPLYERVARASKDEGMLLDFLERKAALPSATVAEVREGVELALGRGELRRAEALLERAGELARAEAGGPDRKVVEWALLELAEVRRRSGNLPGAVAALEEAREVADPARVLRLYQDLARRALEEGGDAGAAAKVYERLWEREPGERRTWEPLLAVYAKLGDRASVERVARATAERVFDPAERNAVRMAHARFLAGLDRRDPALVEVLRDVLGDTPTHQEAIELLADVYQATGNEEGLTELLIREIDSARARGDVPALVALSLRLGQRLLRNKQPGEARDVYRRALAASPDDVPTLRALSRLLSPTEDARERAAVLERLLENETGREAGSLAIELGALHEALGDEERVRRALELGVARAGGDQAVFERLGEFYRSRHAYDRLAILMVEESERRSSPDERANLLREAASIHRNSLGRPRDAAELLRQARRFAPRDAALLSDLVGSLDALGEGNAAIVELTDALSGLPADSIDRVVLLQTRADLHEKVGEYEAAVGDREGAYRAGGEGLLPSLRETLQRWRAHAAERGDAVAERRAALRVYELASRSGDEAAARAVLADWCYRHPEDAESLRLLVQSDQAAERWDAVVESAFRLIEVETGAAQIAAAQLLVQACERLGQPAPAIAGLEAALRAQPEDRWLFETLMTLYDRSGEGRKQAALLLWAGERNSDPELQYQALRQAGEIFLRERDLDNATAAFQRAIALKPADRELSMLVAEALLEGGKHAEAEEILEGHMKRAAKDLTSVELSGLQYRMAKLAEARGDQGGRLDWLRKAFDTNRKNAPVAIELADLAESVNDTDLAVKALRAVTLLPPSSAKLTPAMAFLRQARIAQRSGDRPRAVIFAKRALQEDPRLSDAVDFLRELGERRA